MKIIFVCTGNTCRSPMAEALMKKYCMENGLDFDISSGGIMLEPDVDVSRNSVIAMQDYGIDISAHEPKAITIDDISEADLILTMTSSHAEFLKNATPQFAQKIYTLAEISGADEIIDPFGQSLDVYRSCAEKIDRAISALLDKLKNDDK